MHVRNKNLIQIILLLIVSVTIWRIAFSQYQDSLSSFQPQRDWLVIPPTIESISNSHTSLEPEEALLLDEGTRHASYFINRNQEILGTQNDKILHFVQISDIHVSMFTQKGGLSHLEAILYNEIPLIAPDLVLATGDLTDGKAAHFLTSHQQENEWIAYYNVLKESRVMRRNQGLFYMDQRGNHDCWNVASFSSAVNYFKGHSAIKKEGYIHTIEKDFGKYTFIALDGCPRTGPGRPFNFFGYFDTSDMDFLASTLITSIKERHNHTFGLSHYPTGTTLFGKTKHGIGFWDMTQHVSIWLCGHLHKLAGGLGDQMYAFQEDKVLELELGDMKSHGMFRIIAIDHDLVSFIDIPLYQEATLGKLPLPARQSYKSQSYRPPIVLITNPKDSRFIIPGKEPLSLIRDSSHIRVLIWAKTSLKTIKCTIDGNELQNAPESYHGRGKPWSNISNLNEFETHIPLYTIPWNPQLYNDNEIHFLTVVATDTSGIQGNHTVRFRLDGNRVKKMDSGIGGFIISIPLGLLFKDLFLVTYIFVVIGFLLMPKIFVLLCEGLGIYEEWKKLTSESLVAIDAESQRYWLQVRPTFTDSIRHRWKDFKFTMVATFLRFCELAKIPNLFYPLYGFALYVTVGPWFVGDFVPSTDTSMGAGKRWGWLMTYGVWFNDGSWEPILDTWVYAWYGLLYTLFPLMFYLSFHVLPPNLTYSSTNERLKHPIHLRKSIHYLVIVILIYHGMDTCSMSIFYGLVSTIVSPGKTWILIWAYFKLKWCGIFGAKKDIQIDSGDCGKRE